MWFDYIQILIQNPHDAFETKNTNWLAWVAYHRAIDWLRLGVKLKLELACVEINMINCVILRTSMVNSYAQPVGSRELDSLIWSCLPCALARLWRFRVLIQKINREGRCGVLEG